ncbi:hypothetical protein [Bacillus kwashiorkori]|uniref:hypothetical protein n=1 Tax=Bacillus kwashiorkori TaxID=1522318 RepID=UPI001319B8C3|nr:hypothetical protein [Bacillus kwashiorkori]
MTNKDKNNQAKNKYEQGSGSQYHLENASHVPDYGGNIVDPNANREALSSDSELMDNN